MGNFYFLKRKNLGNIIVLLTTITPSKKKKKFLNLDSIRIFCLM